MGTTSIVLVDADGRTPEVLTAAPAGDTGQAALAVRVVSQLGAGGGGGGGGIVQQGAKDASAAEWLAEARARVWTGAAWVELVQPLTDAQLRAAAVPVGDGGGSLTVDGPLTDGQLRAAAVLVDLVEAVALDATVAAVRDRLPGALVGGRLDVNVGASTPVDVSDRAARLLGKAREDTAAMSWVATINTAPAANAVQADTGALAAGEYDFDVQLGISDTVAVGKMLVLEHRNAANAATLFSLGSCVPGAALQIRLRRYTLALNERLRVIAGTAAGAASSRYQAAIGRRLS